MDIRKEPLSFLKPDIREEEINEVIDSLKSGWLTAGPKTKIFEDNFSKYVGAEYSIGVINCTVALYMSLVASKIKPSSEVITTPLTWCSTANVIEQLNLKTVFADVNKKTGCIDPEKIKEKITEKTKAIIPVHYTGQPCDMDPITELADKHNLTIIEDAAHAVGASYKNRKIGTISRFTCFSFYANKNITTGQGGMITVNNEEDVKLLRMMRLHGLQEGAAKRYSEKSFKHYLVEFPGYNFTMFDIQAAIGIHQLKKLDKNNAKRKKIMETYDKKFSQMDCIEILEVKDYTTSHGMHLYTILVDIDNLNINRDEFVNELRSINIGTGLHYDALHLHPYYQRKYGFKRGDFPSVEYISDRTISLPFFPSMTEEDVEYVISGVKKIIKKYRK